MKKYGFENGCYWKIIETQEQANEHWQGSEDYAQKNIARGNCLFINEKGGYHCGPISNKKDIHMSDSHPTIDERLEALLDNEGK